jgi:hypothetical protein
VDRTGDHSLGDFEVLADVQDLRLVPALVRFGDADFCHGDAFRFQE